MSALVSLYAQPVGGDRGAGGGGAAPSRMAEASVPLPEAAAAAPQHAPPWVSDDFAWDGAAMARVRAVPPRRTRASSHQRRC